MTLYQIIQAFYFLPEKTDFEIISVTKWKQGMYLAH